MQANGTLPIWSILISWSILNAVVSKLKVEVVKIILNCRAIWSWRISHDIWHDGYSFIASLHYHFSSTTHLAYCWRVVGDVRLDTCPIPILTIRNCYYPTIEKYTWLIFLRQRVNAWNISFSLLLPEMPRQKLHSFPVDYCSIWEYYSHIL